MIKDALLGFLTVVLISLSAESLSSTHHLEARLDPRTPLPDGTALGIRYEQGMEAWLDDRWQRIAVLSATEGHPDSSLLNYRLIIQQAHRVRASVATVSIQYRLTEHE